MKITLLLQLKPIGTGHFVHQLINAGTKKAAITVPVVMPLHYLITEDHPHKYQGATDNVSQHHLQQTQ